MEIILKQDVEFVGFKDDLVTVKAGYGRNYLIPQGFAVLATSSEKKILAETLKQRKYKESKIVEKASKDAEIVKTLEIKLNAKVGSGGKLFGSISNVDLAKELSKGGVELDKKYIQIPGRIIKTVGKYTASVRLHREVIIPLNFEVTAEQ